jgi:hypothetical protein
MLDLTTTVTWLSSITRVADVSNALGSQGQATCFAAGMTTVSAQHGSTTGSTTLTCL